MALSKKHYIEIAKIISNAQRQNTGEQACDHIASDLCDMFQRDNSAFNRDKFLEACEPQREPNWSV